MNYIISMPLQSSGTISLMDIGNEFGLTAPYSMNAMYGLAQGIPLSGSISIQSFYGKSMTPPLLYSFTSITLTPSGASGRNGPTLDQCKSAYSGYSWIENTDYFNVVDGIQYWTVPRTGSYRFEVAGAKGGDSGGVGKGGKGVVGSNVVSLNVNDKIKILVGQSGWNSTNIALGGGGGGGSFVVNATTNTVLCVAGGGGGGGGEGQLQFSGEDGREQDGPDSGRGYYYKSEYVTTGGTGGGYTGDSWDVVNDVGGGWSFTTGGYGGFAYFSNWSGIMFLYGPGTYGGFGGGGAGLDTGGGGGGYKGGYNQSYDVLGPAGGGYSKNLTFIGYNNGQGYVNIQAL